MQAACEFLSKFKQHEVTLDLADMQKVIINEAEPDKEAQSFMFKVLNLKSDIALVKFKEHDFLLKAYLHPWTFLKTFKTNESDSGAKIFFNTNISVYDSIQPKAPQPLEFWFNL